MFPHMVNSTTMAGKTEKPVYVFKVENEVESFPGLSSRVTPQSLGAFTELAEAIHALGTKIFVQLTAGFGRVAVPYRLQGGPPVSASANPYFWDPRQTCREIRTAEYT